MNGPYVNLNDAAKYCGYSSGDSFRKALQDEGLILPRCGFKNKSRYAISDLDTLMTTPEVFKKETHLVHRCKAAKVVI